MITFLALRISFIFSEFCHLSVMKILIENHEDDEYMMI